MSTATDMLAEYLAAESAILQGQSFTFEGRTLTRADLDTIRKGRREWERKVSAERARAAGAPTVGGLTFSVARLD
ncbi:MAG: hypothetical protein ACOCYE_10385 [Pseudomonadota bacterium]